MRIRITRSRCALGAFGLSLSEEAPKKACGRPRAMALVLTGKVRPLFPPITESTNLERFPPKSLSTTPWRQSIYTNSSLCPSYTSYVRALDPENAWAWANGQPASLLRSSQGISRFGREFSRIDREFGNMKQALHHPMVNEACPLGITAKYIQYIPCSPCLFFSLTLLDLLAFHYLRLLLRVLFQFPLS
jgi:hypothetical protein